MQWVPLVQKMEGDREKDESHEYCYREKHDACDWKLASDECTDEESEPKSVVI